MVESTVTIGVPGLSAVQDLLQVPSFLLLPGVLFLKTFAVIWRRLKRTFPGVEPPALLAAYTTEFWIISVTLSILIVWFYPFVTAFVGQPRDVLLGYGLKDVVFVWFGSILFGLAAVIVVGVAWRIGRAVAQWRAAKTQFTENDDVLTVLQRLKLLNRSPRLPFIAMSGGAPGASNRLFNLGVDRASTDKVWAIPAALVRATPGDHAQFLFDLQTKVDDDDLEAFRVKLQEGIDARSIKLDWADQGQYRRPTLLDATVFKETIPPNGSSTWSNSEEGGQAP